jgi:integrase
LAEIQVLSPALAAEIEANISSIMNRAKEGSTNRSYESVLASVMKAFPCELWGHLLPCLSAGHLTVLFAGLRGKPWGSTRVAKSALRAWHWSRNQADLWDFVSHDPVWLQFWAGLKKEADHSSRATKAMELDQLLHVLKSCLDGHDTAAGVRDAAWAALTYFGVRRISETTALRLQDVSWRDDGVDTFVAKSKTDQEGRGLTCFVPFMPELGDLCPVALLKAWWTRMGADQAAPDRALFCVTKGSKAGRQAPCATLRSRIDKAMFDPESSAFFSCHSLRKGGASFWIAKGIPESHVQKQGGWQNLVTMRRTYLDLEVTRARDAFSAAGQAVFTSTALPKPTTAPSGKALVKAASKRKARVSGTTPCAPKAAVKIRPRTSTAPSPKLKPKPGQGLKRKSAVSTRTSPAKKRALSSAAVRCPPVRRRSKASSPSA